MRKLTRLSVALLALAAGASGVRAQGMPTSQPSILSIFIEEVQVGMDADHAANEAGWPAAYAKTGSPFYYMALASMTGSSEVWFLAPYASWTQEGENMKQTDADPELSAELARLWRADGQYLTSARTVQAVARPDLSYGAFPNLGLVRFYEITTFRVRPGHEEGFEAAVKMYTEALTRACCRDELPHVLGGRRHAVSDIPGIRVRQCVRRVRPDDGGRHGDVAVADAGGDDRDAEHDAQRRDQRDHASLPRRSPHVVRGPGRQGGRPGVLGAAALDGIPWGSAEGGPPRTGVFRIP